MGMSAPACPICEKGRLGPGLVYDHRPEGETDFGIPPAQYRREYLKCDRCGHYFGCADFDFSKLYSEHYVTSTYGSDLKSRFEKIRALPPGKSDNFERVNRIEAWMREKHPAGIPSVLDVGSGLCVFLDLLSRRTGWKCTALDPDARQAAHAREVVGIDAIHADFLKFEDAGRKFDLITLNKVLEHVPDPVDMLWRTKRFLKDGGRVYVELPDAEGALADSQFREEFFIDHLHVFTMESMRILGERAGFRVEGTYRIVEPSGKYTICMFLAS
jgi:SAM-dependent methyltransferase